MANFNPLGNFGFIAVGQESTAGTVVAVTDYIRTTDEDIAVSYNRDPIVEQSGTRSKNIRSAQGLIEAEGDISFYIEPRKVGHFLKQIFGAPVTQTTVASTSYRHTFKVQDSDKTVTLEVTKAGAPWKYRFFGCHARTFSLEKEDNKIKATVTQVPTRAFVNARVTVAASSGTTLKLDQTTGLKATDVILVIRQAFPSTGVAGYTTIEQLTVNSVDSESQITTGAAITQSLAVDDIVVLKRDTINASDFSSCEVFQFHNGTAFYDGVDIHTLSSVTKEDFTLEFTNEVMPKHGSGNDEIARYAFDVLTGEFECTGSYTKFWDSQKYIDLARSAQPIGTRALFKNNKAISANAAVQAASTFNIPSGSNGFTVTATAAGTLDGKAGNDVSIVFTVNTSDALAATISGNKVTIKLASTTQSANTGTLIAAAVNALTGVDAAAAGTGADQFSSLLYASSITGDGSFNLGENRTDTTIQVSGSVVGLDALEESYLQVDLPATVIDPYSVPSTVSDALSEEVPFTAEVDSACDNLSRKNYDVKVILHNDVASY